jgi:mannose-1-phosphate guanylyltransferase/mannose-6-phosphate isomerase
MLIPVLLAGGVGSRLWPLSRQSRPKQFLSLTGAKSLLEQTLTRLSELEDTGPPLLVGQEAHRFVIAEQLRSAGLSGRILLESSPRDTAAAAAAAAFEAQARYGDDVELLVLPTDHAVGDAQAFVRAIARARAAAARGRLTLFGVAPDRPETGYGYIDAGEPLAEGVRAVAAFVEKPDGQHAAAYLAAGHYYWNSGMFLFVAADYLAALAQHAPDIHDAVGTAHRDAIADIDFLRLAPAAFDACRADSIDYAVMEKTEHAVMVAFDAGWNDLGSWSAVARANGVDDNGNSARGDVWLDGTHDCVVHSEKRLVAALGTRDQVIVETADAVLVADRSREQDIRKLVADLRAAGRLEADEYRKMHRPWGSYEQIAVGPRFQVKHIRVTPGGRLSLQKHHHRAEHWIVVHGTALVTCDERETLLSENQSTFIPLGAVHRLENPGKVDLDLIEVQSGSYLGEDDIVRYDDVYGRIEAVQPHTGAPAAVKEGS